MMLGKEGMREVEVKNSCYLFLEMLYYGLQLLVEQAPKYYWYCYEENDTKCVGGYIINLVITR